MGRASDSRQEHLTASSGLRVEWRITESPRVFAVLMGQSPEEHRLVRVFGGFLISDVVSARCQAARRGSGSGS